MAELGGRADCAVTTERFEDRARLIPSGQFDLAHAPSVERALEEAEPELQGFPEVEIDLAHLQHIDGGSS